MKKIVFSLILATSLFSCSNNEKLVDNGQNADMNETTLVSRLNNGGSVG